MRIGVICEGPSDYPSIEKFFGQILINEGFLPKFKALYPRMDKTRPQGGWANVLLWLRNNPPNIRIRKYFSGGLFGGELEAEKLDAILLHLDADVVDDASFKRFVFEKYQIQWMDVGASTERGAIIRRVLRASAQFDGLTEADQRRHVIAPAVDSTETWCVAAFVAQPSEWEEMRIPELTDAFMKALEKSEGRAVEDVYANCDKDFKRRLRFCEVAASRAERIKLSCPHFETAAADLVANAP